MPTDAVQPLTIVNLLEIGFFDPNQPSHWGKEVGYTVCNTRVRFGKGSTGELLRVLKVRVGINLVLPSCYKPITCVHWNCVLYSVRLHAIVDYDKRLKKLRNS